MNIIPHKLNLLELVPIMLVSVMVLAVLLPISPINQPIPRRDSGVFLYSGWRWLNGEIPYLDVWDHKPPMIFLINAIGLLASNSSRWGIWAIELTALLTASLISFSVFRRAFDKLSAFLAVFLWLFSLVFMIYGGNLTTEYTLPLQFGCLWLFWNSELTKKYRRNGFMIGLLGSFMFFTQQVTVGIVISILFYIVTTRTRQRKWSEMRVYLTSISIGFLVLAVSIVIYFGIQGGLSEFWDAAFAYNFTYVSTPTFSERLKSIYRGWLLLATTNMLWVGILGWCIALSSFLTSSFPKERRQSSLLLLGLIYLPVEIALASVGGRLINHHFMVLLPVFSLFAAYFFHLVLSGIRSWLSEQRQKILGRVTALAFALALPLIYLQPINDYTDIIKEYRDSTSTTMELIDFVERHSTQNDTLLCLTAESTINFMTHRKSPTKYIYQYPLRMPGYTSEEMILSFLQQLHQKPPALIINHLGRGLGSEYYAITSSQIDHLVTEVEGGYELVATIGDWNVYQHK